ncbi:MAG: 4Fe-4S dicluster domain-containing protein, partial [Candidatus Eisenbacteria bacterium]|nr:4Fe-4S dicluster domain-containing protein [Candidatus Eisenbacteria bacterium]
MTSAPAGPNVSWFDTHDAPQRRDLETCIHCGLCLTACPTYRTLKLEPDSPRGRLYLMRGLAEGTIEPDDQVLHHLDQCLDCRACETVCPAGVPYGHLLEQTRGQLERRARRIGPLRWLGRLALEQLLPHRGRMIWVAEALRIGQRAPFAALMRSPLARRVLPRFATQGFDMTPAIAPRAERRLARVEARLSARARMERRDDALVFHPAGTARMHVAYFKTCVMDTFFSLTSQDTVR